MNAASDYLAQFSKIFFLAHSVIFCFTLNFVQQRNVIQQRYFFELTIQQSVFEKFYEKI